MTKFMMLFRHIPNSATEPSTEDMSGEIKKWQDWIGSIAAQGKFIGTNQLQDSGKMLSPEHVITDGPYTEVKEIVGGYMMVKAENYDDALEMAKGCPVLTYGNTVEVREIVHHEHLD